MVYALAMSTGPIIGGALVERVDWRWCFYINLPCDGAAFILLVLFLKVHNPRTDFRRGLAAIDWLGTLFVIGATLMLLLGLQYGGEQYAWSSVVVLCLIIFGVVVFGVFLGIEWKVAKYPLLPKRLFTRRDVIALFVLISMHGFAMYATTYFIPFYFQEVLGATAIKSAVWFLPSACMMAIFSIVTGLYLRFTGKYTWLIICGMGICTLGIGLLIDLPSYISWPRIIIYQLLVGLGLGPNFQAPLLALQAKFPPADVGVAVSAASAIRSLSAAFSIILGGVIIENRLAAHRKDFVAAGIPPSTAAQIAGSGASGSHEIIGKLPQMQQRVLLQALRDSLSNMWIFYTSLMVIGFAASFFIGRVSLSSDHVEHKTGLQTEEANRLVHAKKPVSETEMA